MDVCIDVDLMEQCGRELADWFVSAKPTKILMIAMMGLVIAIREFCQRALGVHISKLLHCSFLGIRSINCIVLFGNG